MKNSLPRKRLEEILAEVLSLLDGDTVRGGIDESIDAAASTFKHSGSLPTPIDNEALLFIVGEFVAHVYEHGLPLSRILTPEQAQAEAVYFLERTYQGGNANGYEGALRDIAKYGKDGLRIVFLALADAIKEMQRQRYVHWVLVSRIQQLDWSIRRDLTAIILERWGEFLDEAVEDRSPEELTPACAELIVDYAGSDLSLRQVFSAPGRARGGAS